jgi:hypothetical protein
MVQHSTAQHTIAVQPLGWLENATNMILLSGWPLGPAYAPTHLLSITDASTSSAAVAPAGSLLAGAACLPMLVQAGCGRVKAFTKFSRASDTAMSRQRVTTPCACAARPRHSSHLHKSPTRAPQEPHKRPTRPTHTSTSAHAAPHTDHAACSRSVAAGAPSAHP